MSPPNITWVFKVNRGVGLRDREEYVYAPVDADFYALELELFRAGYIRVVFVRKEWEKWAWPGGYPLYYVCEDSGILCSQCANDEIEFTSNPEAESMWKIAAAEINYEDDNLECCHCNKMCESAYGEPDSEGLEPSDADALASAGHGTDEDYGSAEDML